MNKILLTGISGNVGKSTAEYLDSINVVYIGGVKAPEKYMSSNPDKKLVKVDLEDKSTYREALKGIERVFLMRPPALTDVKGIFIPFINECKAQGVKHIVFLSLLGIEKNPFPPHYKIEKAIIKSGIPYTFIRPSFFMQNLTGIHAEDIRERNDIFIPSGKAKISFIDTKDIGEIIGRVITEDKHYNKAYTITGREAVDYFEIAKLMTKILGRSISYSNPSILSFRKAMINRGIEKEFATVMSVLYLTTKLGMANIVNNTAEKILGRKPISVEAFIQENIDIFTKR